MPNWFHIRYECGQTVCSNGVDKDKIYRLFCCLLGHPVLGTAVNLGTYSIQRENLK